MKIIARCLALLSLLGSLTPGRSLSDVSTICNPNPAVWESFPASVAVDGNFALVGAEYWDRSTEPTQLHQTAFLYQRSGVGWTLVRQLEETVVPSGVPRNLLSVAMGNGIAAVRTTPMKIYEQGPGGWLLAPSEIPVNENAALDLEIDNGRIINNKRAAVGRRHRREGQRRRVAQGRHIDGRLPRLHTHPTAPSKSRQLGRSPAGKRDGDPIR